MERWQFSSADPEATRALGALLGTLVEGDLALFLDGDLGSGKTCLAQGVAAGLGVPADEPVTSPTYTLMNHYQGRHPLYHFDLYRLGSAGDLEEIGFEEFAAAPGVIIVEWASQVLPPDRNGLYVSLAHAGGDHRLLSFIARGPAARHLLGSLAAAWDQGGEAP